MTKDKKSTSSDGKQIDKPNEDVTSSKFVEIGKPIVVNINSSATMSNPLGLDSKKSNTSNKPNDSKEARKHDFVEAEKSDKKSNRIQSEAEFYARNKLAGDAQDTVASNQFQKKKYVPNYEALSVTSRPSSSSQSSTPVSSTSSYEVGKSGQTTVKQLEVVSNSQSKPLAYKPKLSGGIFTSSEPTPVVQTPPKPTPIPKPVVIVKPVEADEIFFYVQVYAHNERFYINTVVNPHLKNHEIFIEDGQYKYLIGKSRDLKSVAKLCLDVRDKGQPDAFIVKYVNGKRVPFLGN
ncbi:MAG: hypothetical protein IPK03_04390 [Bacteroidetes bacterium]|nr:hypothetical protein [Bacteroidota bacterium]